MLFKGGFIILIILIFAVYIILTSNIKLNIQNLIENKENLEITIQKLLEPQITESDKLFNGSILIHPEILTKTVENEREKPIQKLPEALIIGSPKCGIY
jgi:hypothetical protein